MKKSARLNRELIFLSNRKTFQIRDLMSEFGISKRTALRDIAELESMGLALYAEYGRQGGYRLLKPGLLTPIHFTYEEIYAIFYALKALNRLSVNPFGSAYEDLAQKLFASLSKSQQEEVTKTLDVIHYYNVFPINAPQFLSEILEAILHEQVLDILYTQYGQERKSLQFFDLFYREGVWFVHALDREQEKWGVYRCDHIVELTKNARFVPYSRADLSHSLEKHESNFRTIPFRCRLTAFGKELFLKNHYEQMRLEEVDGTIYLIGFYNERESAYLTHYLVEFGQHLTIDYPEDLKRQYLTCLKKMMEKNSL